MKLEEEQSVKRIKNKTNKLGKKYMSYFQKINR